ncbi:hypothetical protein HPB48_009718 [Haemaphysalis longicornis]|uniref:Uncharacterized protein n=1 Tax=Haemaphysalis longicornis TaxID=44386 RepID=A0A9J6G9X5_HAELO|nr:hypothetical protein HPB48_009718 [Haemaphysalis longicornis]
MWSPSKAQFADRGQATRHRQQLGRLPGEQRGHPSGRWQQLAGSGTAAGRGLAGGSRPRATGSVPSPTQPPEAPSVALSQSPEPVPATFDFARRRVVGLAGQFARRKCVPVRAVPVHWSGAMLKGWFDAFRSEGGPTLYAHANRTAVTEDVRNILIYVCFSTLFIAFVIVFPGIRKERAHLAPNGTTRLSFAGDRRRIGPLCLRARRKPAASPTSRSLSFEAAGFVSDSLLSAVCKWERGFARGPSLVRRPVRSPLGAQESESCPAFRPFAGHCGDWRQAPSPRGSFVNRHCLAGRVSSGKYSLSCATSVRQTCAHIFSLGRKR